MQKNTISYDLHDHIEIGYMARFSEAIFTKYRQQFFGSTRPIHL